MCAYVYGGSSCVHECRYPPRTIEDIGSPGSGMKGISEVTDLWVWEQKTLPLLAISHNPRQLSEPLESTPSIWVERMRASKLRCLRSTRLEQGEAGSYTPGGHIDHQSPGHHCKAKRNLLDISYCLSLTGKALKGLNTQSKAGERKNLGSFSAPGKARPSDSSVLTSSAV